MAHDEEDEDEYEDVEQVLFQGAMFDREADLKKNPRLVKAALVPVKRMISDALARRAHTILLEPTQGRIAIRFVVDGIPYPAGAIPGQRGMAMVQMLKVLGGLNPQDRGDAQTGGIQAEFEDVKYHLLLESTPVGGSAERMRVRVENPKKTYLTAEDCGMPEELSDRIRELSDDPKGIILACGPPESGATSLSVTLLHCVDPYLYSVFNMSDFDNDKLINVTEYEPEEGHDLELSLDRVLRREADVLFVNPLTEPTDVQTMFKYADRACFFGEIPAATPHEALEKLIAFVGKDEVAKHVKAIVSQKLIRVLCDDCKQAFRPNPQLLKRLSLPPETTVLYRAPSPPDPEDPEAATIEELCEDCDGVPYHGRLPVYDVLEMSEGMQDVIRDRFDPTALKEQMAEEGMRVFQKDAIRLVAEGRTSLEEVQRAFRPAGAAGRKRRPRR